MRLFLYSFNISPIRPLCAPLRYVPPLVFRDREAAKTFLNFQFFFGRAAAKKGREAPKTLKMKVFQILKNRLSMTPYPWVLEATFGPLGMCPLIGGLSG